LQRREGQRYLSSGKSMAASSPQLAGLHSPIVTGTSSPSNKG
jgi:hypothetical protein